MNKILPCPRQLESVTQPLLYTPYPHPACSFSCLCCKCCSNQNLSLQQTIKKEGTWEIEHQPFTVQQAAAESSKKEDENSQRKGLRRRGDDNESKKQGNREGSKDSKGEKELKDPSLDEDATESDSLLPKRDDSVILELMSPSRRTEGLYPGEGPVITQLLLRSEPVDLPISAVVRNGVYLSRSVLD